MTTSGSTNFTHTAEQIIRDALYKINALEEGEAITGDHTESGLRALNRLLKNWNTKTLRWAREEAVLFLNKDQRVYSLPGDNCASGQFGFTRLNGAHAASATALTVDATAPGQPHPAMLASDKIGIELSDGTRFWTTVSSVDTGTTLTLASGLSGAASDDATVFWYTTEIERPVRTFTARRGAYNGSEVPLDLVARDIYMEQPNKGASGMPVMGHYAPQIGTGKFYVWPTSGTAQNVVWFSYQRTLEDVDEISNTIDMPEEFAEALVYALAVRLSDEYHVAVERQMVLKTVCDEILEDAGAFDEDDTELQVTPWH